MHEVLLVDLLSFSRDGEWGKGEPTDGHVPMRVIRGTDFERVRRGDLSTLPLRYIRKDIAERKGLRAADIIIETAGGTKDQETGRTLFINKRLVDSADLPLICASFCRFLRVKSEVIHPEFLFWKLHSDYQSGLLSPYHVQHTGVARFQFTDFAGTYRFCIPSRLAEQRAIASVLSPLDDKIELNRRMNETLEEMARALFKDWFVDFGPTRAKMESQEPYLAPELWDLFPHRLDDEGKPEGWALGTIQDLLDLAYGKSLPAARRIPGRFPVYGSGGIGGYHNEALVRGPAVIVGRKGTVGSLFWEDRSCFPIDTVFYVVPKSAPLTFCYHLLQHQKLGDMNTDAAVPGLNRNNVYRLIAPVPPSEIVVQFDALATALRDRITANNDEARTLAQTRDLLLPKLISGEIQVKDAEKTVEAVV